MGKYIDIITAIGALLTKILPTKCKSKCCSGSECECGEKNLIDEELEKSVENAEMPTV